MHVQISRYRDLYWKGKLIPDHENSKNFHSEVKLESHNEKRERVGKMVGSIVDDSDLVPLVGCLKTHSNFKGNILENILLIYMSFSF